MDSKNIWHNKGNAKNLNHYKTRKTVNLSLFSKFPFSQMDVKRGDNMVLNVT